MAELVCHQMLAQHTLHRHQWDRQAPVHLVHQPQQLLLSLGAHSPWEDQFLQHPAGAQLPSLPTPGVAHLLQQVGVAKKLHQKLNSPYYKETT